MLVLHLFQTPFSHILLSWPPPDSRNIPFSFPLFTPSNYLFPIFQFHHFSIICHNVARKVLDFSPPCFRPPFPQTFSSHTHPMTPNITQIYQQSLCVTLAVSTPYTHTQIVMTLWNNLINPWLCHLFIIFGTPLSQHYITSLSYPQ